MSVNPRLQLEKERNFISRRLYHVPRGLQVESERMAFWARGWFLVPAREVDRRLELVCIKAISMAVYGEEMEHIPDFTPDWFTLCLSRRHFEAIL